MELTIHPTMERSRWPEWSNAFVPGILTSVTAWDQSRPLQVWSHPHPMEFRHDWLDTEERQAYMEATVEQDIAWQIKVNRVKRGLTQQQLAQAIGSRQSAVARLEDAEYGRASIPTLIKVAHAFDCALIVRLISYSELAALAEDTSEEALFAKPFHMEKRNLEAAND